MEKVLTEEKVLNDLITTCQQKFGFSVLETMPIKRGWLNLKWKMITDSGVFLIKQYNKARYEKYNHEELLNAFSQQMRLHEKGLPCPKLLSYEGQVLFESNEGELFLVMEYCEGDVILPGKLNTDQMHSLGQVTGYMHRLLNDGTMRNKRTPEFVPPSPEERLACWESVWNQANESGQTHLLPIIETQLRVTKTIKLEDFNLNEPGWSHRDLWVDNLLFKNNRVSALLDFDRMKYDHPQLDVARAVISGILNENGLDASLVSAFLNGYCENCSVEKGFVTKALKLLWYMESTWWIHSKMDQQSGPPQRFAKEMIWLSEHYRELETILENI